MKAGAFKRITVAVDGSPASEAGVRCVLSLAAISSRSRRLDRPTNVGSDRGHLSVIRRNRQSVVLSAYSASVRGAGLHTF
jgi:hypothetical protein